MNVYIWTSGELKNAYIGEKPFELEKIFDFTTADLHWFTNKTTWWSWLIIDTSNHWCTRATANWSNWTIYKSAGYSHCWQRMKANFNYSSWTGGMILWIWQHFVEDNKCWFWIWIIERTTVRIFKYWDVSNYSNYSLPSWWNANTDYYYDLIFDNWTLTAEIYDTSMNKIFSQTFSWLNSTIPHIWFCMHSWSTSQWAAYIKEYRLAYEE